MTTSKGDAIECQAASTSVGEAPGAEREQDVARVSADLREAQAELRRLRAFLSHNLRQPLASLSIWAELLNSKHGAALDDQGRRYLRELTASVQRIAAMLAAEVAASAPAADPAAVAAPATRASDPSDG